MLRRAGDRCEICGAPEDRAARQRLDLHERWDYDERASVQRLRRLIAVCQPCHEVTHFGLANIRGRTEEAFAHLRTVTGMNHRQNQAAAHVDTAQQVWIDRSQRTWELDLSMLSDIGLTIRRPPARGERAGHAERALREARIANAVVSGPVAPSPRPRAEVAAAAQSAPRLADSDPVSFAAALATDGWHGGPDDLARNAPGIGVVYEAARRRQTEGAGADRSWRIGADGEATVAEVLATLTMPGRLDRLRHRPPAWRVLHSVPVGTGRGDIDHVLIGPPGVVTINTKHHRAGRLALDGDELVVNGRPTDYVPKARHEAERAAVLLAAALTATGRAELAARLRVRPMLAVVGGRVLIASWAPGVAIVMTRQLVHTLTSMAAAITAEQVDDLYSIARHRRVWARPTS